MHKNIRAAVIGRDKAISADSLDRLVMVRAKVSRIDGVAGAWRSYAIAARQAHGKHRTLARLARHGHVAAHQARELARDGKAEAGAAEALRGRSIGLGKFLEQFRLLLRGHADTAIGNCHLDPIASIDKPSRLELDLARFGELAGIAQ